MTRANYFWLAAILIVLGGAFFNARKAIHRRQSAEMASGEFELLEVTRRGEPFRAGSSLERLLDKVIPAGGVAIGPVQLRKPEQFTPWEDAPLVAWLLYRGTNIGRRGTSPFFGARVVAENSAGRQIENPLPLVVRARSNEVLISLPLVAFPRDESRIRLRFSPPATNETSREWVSFGIDNPLPVALARWAPEPLPKTNIVEHESAVLERLTVHPVVCQFKLPGPGWIVPQCSIQDAEGNVFRSSTSSWNQNVPEVISRSFTYTLETNLPWRIEATFLRATNFAPSDLRIVRLAANAAPVAITNRLGLVCDCLFDGRALSIFGRANDGPPTWLVVTATNRDSGRALKLEMDAQSSGITGRPIGKFWTPIEINCTNIVLQLADPKGFTTEWFVDPSHAARTPERLIPFTMRPIAPQLPPPLR